MGRGANGGDGGGRHMTGREAHGGWKRNDTLTQEHDATRTANATKRYKLCHTYVPPISSDPCVHSICSDIGCSAVRQATK